MRVYCDASFDERIGVAGIGILIQDGQHERNYSLFTQAPSNNWAELLAIKISGILTHGKAVIYSDSQTAIDMIGGHINNEKERSRKLYIAHKQCEVLAYQIRAQRLHIEKIKAHQKNFQLHSFGNRIADLLAKRGLGKYYAMQKDAASQTQDAHAMRGFLRVSRGMDEGR